MIIVPIIIKDCSEDDIDIDLYEGFGEFFIFYLIGCMGTIPLTYTIIGCLRGFDAWGLIGVSVIIGLMAGVAVNMLAFLLIE